MTKEISSLINVSFNVMTYLGLHKFSVHSFDEYTYVEFAVNVIDDLPTFLDLCREYNVRICAGDDQMLIRLSLKE